ncbi:MAG: hypothetical protein AAGA85_01870 [Bacteroidota bacterium]
MNKKTNILLLGLICLLCSCVGTQLESSWQDRELTPATYENIGIVLLAPKVSSKALVETELASQLRQRGIKALGTFDIFPFASNQEYMDKIRAEGAEKFQARVRERVRKFDLDAILLISVVREEQDKVYHRKGIDVNVAYTIPPGANYYNYGYDFALANHYTYDQFYTHMASTVHSSGYYTTKSTYFLESDLFDVDTGRLVWTAMTKTKDPKSISKEAAYFGKLMAGELTTKKVVAP